MTEPLDLRQFSECLSPLARETMLPALAVAKTLYDVAKPLSETVVKTWLEPQLNEIAKKRRVNQALIQNAFVERFTEYLQRSYEKQSHIASIVFPNQKKLLMDLYVPLTIKPSAPSNEKVTIGEFPEDLVRREQNLLITDVAGMGKSTLLKVMFLKCIEANAGIPVFVELRRLSKDLTILDFILDELNPIDEEFDREFVLARIKRGDFIFFLDGYDEVGFDERKSVTQDLRSFQSKASANRFIMSSRPEAGLASFAEFAEHRIVPLMPPEAFALIRKYGDNQPIAQQLVDKLEKGGLGNIEEFLGNPLLVSLLYKSYEYKPTLAFKKHIFYRQVYDALFESHDLTKEGAFAREKLSGLDSSDFHLVLRAFGFETMKLGRIEYSTDEVLAQLRLIKPSCPGITLREDAFLKDLITSVPLFIREGESYRWAHKSIQEYFAAQFICEDSKERQLTLLKRLYENERIGHYRNVLDLCYDIDYKSFRKAILATVADTLSAHQRKAAKLAKTLKQPRKAVEQRLLLTFGRRVAFLDDDRARDLMEGNAVDIAKIFSGPRRALSHMMIHHIGGMSSNSILELQGAELEIFAILTLKQSKLVHAPVDQMRDAFEPFVIDLGDHPHILLDYRPNNSLNSSANFPRVSRMLSRIARMVPDLAEWRILQREVASEVIRESKNDFLTAGL